MFATVEGCCPLPSCFCFFPVPPFPPFPGQIQGDRPSCWWVSDDLRVEVVHRKGNGILLGIWGVWREKMVVIRGRDGAAWGLLPESLDILDCCAASQSTGGNMHARCSQQPSLCGTATRSEVPRRELCRVISHFHAHFLRLRQHFKIHAWLLSRMRSSSFNVDMIVTNIRAALDAAHIHRLPRPFGR
jgi:hypothetical protein